MLFQAERGKIPASLMLEAVSEWILLLYQKRQQNMCMLERSPAFLLFFLFSSVLHEFDSYIFIRKWKDSLVTIFIVTYKSIIAMAGGDNETRAFRVSEKVALG